MTSKAPNPASPISPPLIDQFGRHITYLRLSITDRCNLRCVYCMPEQGVKQLAHEEILTFEELERLVAMFSQMGITKVRITGGEPFVRLGCVSFIERLKVVIGVPYLHITTNGVHTYRHLEKLKKIGLSGLNVSLDTLDRDRFAALARRDRLERVERTINKALKLGMPLKINSVVTTSTRDDDILSLATLPNHLPVSVRFIEHMPFSSADGPSTKLSESLKSRLYRLFPDLYAVSVERISTARLYKRSRFKGTIGIIEGASRKFCQDCNKVRVTPAGLLKTCLYDDGVLDLKKLLRGGMHDREIETEIRQAIIFRQQNGVAAEKINGATKHPSMATIGG
ncbi:MAG: GTP 3',8-cyclase MoaA [Desulfofustis sp.]|nr:GTP 3',8-cyclase MoaA [Desulfofustis sp.]